MKFIESQFLMQTKEKTCKEMIGWFEKCDDWIIISDLDEIPNLKKILIILKINSFI